MISRTFGVTRVCEFGDNARLPDTLQEWAVGQKAGGNKVYTHFYLGPDDELGGRPGTVDEGILPEKGCEADN